MRTLSFLAFAFLFYQNISAQSDVKKNDTSTVKRTGFAISGLDDMKILSRPAMKDSSGTSGKVVVEITVDKDGNVTEAHATLKGSTITNSQLFIISEKNALKYKFGAAPDGKEKHGRIIFSYGLK
jgi:hypothetical protein